MKKIRNAAAAVLISVHLISCSGSSTSEMKLAEEQIKSADRSMSELASKIGFNKALSRYAHGDFVKFTEGNHPIIGKKKFDELFRDKPGPKTISWEPADARASESGDFGYTWGNWKFAVNDTVYYGNYITVWKKDNDEKWKMLFDGGNGTPPPEN